jgi:hypothetical protein
MKPPEVPGLLVASIFSGGHGHELPAERKGAGLFLLNCRGYPEKTMERAVPILPVYDTDAYYREWSPKVTVLRAPRDEEW